MAGANSTNLDGIYKDWFRDQVSDQTNNRNPFKDLFKFTTEEAGGREVKYPTEVTRNISPMFVGEDSAFADAGNRGHVQWAITQRKLMARVRLTYETMTDTMSSKGAWKRARQMELDGIIKDIARKEEYALCSDGRGVIAIVDDATPSGAATVTVDSPGGITNDNFGTRFFQVGMWIGFVNPATGALRAGIRKIVSLASDGLSITLNAAPDATVADNDYIVQAANSSVTDVLDTSYEHAFWGMVAHVDDGTYRQNYHGIDRSVYGALQSYVKASTGPLSVDVMQHVSDVLAQKLGGKIDLLAGHHSTRRLYINLMSGDRRYSGNSLTRPDAGTVAMSQGDLTVGEIPFKTIRDFPLDMLMLLDKANSGWECFVTEKGKWVDEDGQVFIRAGTGSSGRDAFEAWYRMRKQYHCEHPGYNGRLDGITGQTLIVVQAP